ncbi:MAG: hypothetical protein A2073_03230 [Deltaproteobacteria bacterium GWC2_42_11]|nr:MAG: hypothetical protein A2073_03230 [Deltaproteobacteria bacterium GWC2_42_11]HBO84217.1 AsnC family transcriptional regulator [Deltaproteobacteria bacterium]
MAVSAYVLVECEQGKSMDAAKAISKIGGVMGAHSVTGPYDVIAFVTASNFKVLGEVVMKKIQGVTGVKKTLTNIIME